MKYQFGTKIREVRERKGFTMKEVASTAGISESLVSQIERNKVSPAIDTLLGLASALDMDVDYLFQDFKKKRTVNIVRSKERDSAIIGGVKYEQLSKTISDNNEHEMEAYYIELDPESHTGSSEYGHKGVELGIVLEGDAEFEFGNEKHNLHSGDSISYAADYPHQLKNIGDKLLKAVWIVTPPKKIFRK